MLARDKRPSKEELIAAITDYVEPTYFIGYGSLMYPDGINTRGMHHYYKWEDLIPIELSGFKRSFCAVFKNLAFYGIYELQGGEMNAIAFEIHSLHDYAMLLTDEGAHPIYEPPMYNMRNVVDQVEGFDFPAGSRVMILESRNVDEKTGLIPEYYVDGTWYGIKHWGDTFRKRFLETGGMAYNKKDFTKYVNNPWSKDRPILCAKRR